MVRIRRIALGLLTWWGLTALCWAGTVTITMPDDQIHYAIQEVCAWYHCWADGAMYPSEKALATEAANRIVWTISAGHYKTLEATGGKLTITYDQ